MHTRYLSHPSHRQMRLGVESIIPGEADWWATIYGRWLGKDFSGAMLLRALEELGADFTLCYDSLSRDKPQACRRMAQLFGDAEMGFLFNNTYGDIYGPWAPGTGRAEYDMDDIAKSAKSPHFMGVIRDEFAHRQIHHYDCGNGPYLADVSGCTPMEAYDRILDATLAMVAPYEQRKCPNIAEYVFPSLYHLFARAGVAPGPKLLKESCNPVMLAIGLGAAHQYGLPLWAVADHWGQERFWSDLFCRGNENAHGHSPDEYLSALMIAYWMGVDCLYTEGIWNLIYRFRLTTTERAELEQHPMDHRGDGDPMVNGIADKGYLLNVYGKYHRWFATEYLPAHPREYGVSDVSPRIAIIRFPDSCWGQPDIWTSTLFGPNGPAKEARHLAWLDLWPILTHGAMPSAKMWLSAGSNPEELGAAMAWPSSDRHPAFAPLNGVVVYDHLVDRKLLRDVPLLICTGETLSDETSAAVTGCVAAGADCLILDHLAPPELQKRVGGAPLAVSEGRGRWLVVADFRNDATREFLGPHCGRDDEIRYRFAGRDTVIRPVAGDRNRVEVTRESI